ncbi:hypothetical protein ABZY68_29200 [Streptomyces sp. NPDC006482]|uniref:hypothetical protein n=1 Tax=Streptomyces sp. NPDC006482 TaxID=3154306 RepID=UPI0033A97489
MSQEAAPERAVPAQSVPQSVPEQKDAGAPKGLLQQMEELMAALSADLSQLDADIQSSAERLDPEPLQPDPHRSGPNQSGPEYPCADDGQYGAGRQGTEDRGSDQYRGDTRSS